MTTHMSGWDAAEFRKSLNEIPDAVTYLKDLQDLKQLDPALTQDQIHAHFFNKAHLQQNVLASLSSSDINALTAFRVRSNLAPTEDLSLIRTFSYPSTSFCRTNGRANLLGTTTFYCADNPLTAMMESKIQVGEIGYLGIWKNHCDRECHYTGFFPADLPATNPWNAAAVRLNNYVLQKIEEIGSTKTKQLTMLSEFMASMFVDEPPPYILTSWLANSLMYRSNIVDFIAYASFTTRSHQCNMAFHPNFIDQYFALDRVYQFIVVETNAEGGNYTIKKMGRIDQTNIVWTDPSEQDVHEYFPNSKKVSRDSR
jgi:hypothetical protein